MTNINEDVLSLSHEKGAELSSFNPSSNKKKGKAFSHHFLSPIFLAQIARRAKRNP